MTKAGKENDMDKREELEKALKILEEYVDELTVRAGMEPAYGKRLWQGIRQSAGLLRELSYYHDYGRFLCEYQIMGYTLADILVWQVDHFKLYMDRPEEMNRYKQYRLLLTALDMMLKMEHNPAGIVEKMRSETGQDILNA